MEFAFPEWENRLTVSALMTPTWAERRSVNKLQNAPLFTRARMTQAGIMIAYLWVAVGGALGSISRFWISGLVAERYGETFPWNTLVVNVVGSFIIGLFAAFTNPDGRWPASPVIRQFVMVGFCGGFTTFSSFSLQTLNLLRDREWLYAGGNVLLSVITCMFAVWGGFLVGAMITANK